MICRNNLDNQIFCSLLGADVGPPEFLDIVYNKKLGALPWPLLCQQTLP